MEHNDSVDDIEVATELGVDENGIVRPSFLVSRCIRLLNCLRIQLPTRNYFVFIFVCFLHWPSGGRGGGQFT